VLGSHEQYCHRSSAQYSGSCIDPCSVMLCSNRLASGETGGASLSPRDPIKVAETTRVSPSRFVPSEVVDRHAEACI
jgi:hypothetical protein